MSVAHATGRTTIAGLVLGSLLILGSLLTGCYDHRSGNPVDRYHYEHSIVIRPDESAITIKTFVNRTHLKVGFRREDLYDGNRDGELTTPGMDRVLITDYMDVEDPPEAAVRTRGEIRDYDELFRRILEATRSGREIFEIEDRRYSLRQFSEDVTPLATNQLG
jgi:hypothetical protein